jgi:hypothetical protein
MSGPGVAVKASAATAKISKVERSGIDAAPNIELPKRYTSVSVFATTASSAFSALGTAGIVAGDFRLGKDWFGLLLEFARCGCCSDKRG